VEEYLDRYGKPRHSLVVFATDIQFIGTRGDDLSHETSATTTTSQRESNSQPDLTDDTIPF
jgi:hypothetical protein